VGLDKIVERRVGRRSIGFNETEEQQTENSKVRNVAKMKREELLVSDVQPMDLIRYGFIPEFIGRLPVVGVLEDLDREALVQILSKPKNAVIKQYQRLFEFENVRLKFSDDALEAIATLAMERKVGARGLRMILEDLMLDLMYFLPSYKKVREFLVTKEMVLSQKINLAILEKAG
jgi:ATP-dependent Clp protease ATP-binding subunit ClpX